MQPLSWQAPEYIHTDKTVDWYWIVGIVAISIAILAVIFNNLIFALLILVSAITLSLYAARRPRMMTVTIDESGIHVGDIFHPYGTIDSFWVETRDAYPRLIIKSNRRLSPLVAILLGGASSTAVRELLHTRLKEEEHIEPLFEKLLIYLGF